MCIHTGQAFNICLVSMALLTVSEPKALKPLPGGTLWRGFDGGNIRDLKDALSGAGWWATGRGTPLLLTSLSAAKVHNQQHFSAQFQGRFLMFL